MLEQSVYFSKVEAVLAYVAVPPHSCGDPAAIPHAHGLHAIPHSELGNLLLYPKTGKVALCGPDTREQVLLS